MKLHSLDVEIAAEFGLQPQSYYPKGYKRYSANGVVRAYALIDGEWRCVAKRIGAGPWRGMP